ncbi:MAG: MBOAT family protein [Acidimicrobiia bacterium]|nr:MBOAT family protein [Acidimicrobiia bacterium]
MSGVVLIGIFAVVAFVLPKDRDLLQFSALTFFLFYALVLTVFWLLPGKWRWMFALGASYVFYATVGYKLLLLMVLCTLVSFGIALAIGNNDTDRRRKVLLGAGIAFQLGMLIAFKYVDFGFSSIESSLQFLGLEWDAPILSWILPLGLSFYTFMIIGYLMDVFRRDIEPETNPFHYALFVSFFPHIVAGPIDRAPKFLPQLDAPPRFSYTRFTTGLKQMLWGLFKKAVIADRLALATSVIFAAPEEYKGWFAVFAIYGYSIQIYADFSGYTDMALGAARTLGLELQPNFHRPYFAKDIQEFWRRWHISLTTWMRDYLYVPLGGNRRGRVRGDFNILIVFVLSGLWHGSTWNFVIWGTLHAVYQLVGKHTRAWRARFTDRIGLSARPRLHRFIQVFVTFNLVSIAWVFFNAPDFKSATTLLGNVFETGLSNPEVGWRFGDPFFASLAIMLMFGVEWYERKWGSVLNGLNRRVQWQRWLVYSALIWTVVVFGKFGGQEFIYVAF